MNYRTFILILFMACHAVVFGQKKGLRAVTEQEVKEQVEYLASDRLAGRQAGSEGGRMAADYIVNHLQGLGLQPLDGHYLHPFQADPFNYVRFSAGIHKEGADENYHIGNDLNNVMAVIEGRHTDEIVLVGAHYDHVGAFPGLLDGDYIYNGADDNASGTVCLMQIAKAFASMGKKPEKTLILAFWDGEERNCKGSEYFVHNDPRVSNIKHCMNLDMVGRGVADSIACICSDGNKDTYLRWLSKAVSRNKLHLDITTKAEYTVFDDSDQRPFAKAGIPCIWFFSGEHDDVHTPADEASKLNTHKIANTAKAAFYVLWQMCN